MDLLQTEERDLRTLPNLSLVSHPVWMMRTSGVLLYVELSLGYDVSLQKKVERRTALIDRREAKVFEE